MRRSIVVIAGVAAVLTLPWSAGSSYTGCAFIVRPDELAFLRRPRLYYLDVRTQTARHAAVAHPRGPHLYGRDVNRRPEIPARFSLRRATALYTPATMALR